MIPTDIYDFLHISRTIRKDIDIYVCKAQATFVTLCSSSGTFGRFVASITNNSLLKKLLLGREFRPKIESRLGRVGRDRSSFLQADAAGSWKSGPITGYHLLEKGILETILSGKGASLIDLPNYSRLVTDCAKMQFLDKLLAGLHKGGHRCLIFC